ncbi:phage tail protein, partial [Yersinia enterocolitica]
MQKIGDIPNTRADNNGEFTDGNVAGGVPPTILPAEWFNTIQRELMSILNAAEIESDPHVFNQVLLSIQKLVSEGIPDLKDASLTQKGIVQLSNSTNSTSQILAATPKAVSDLGASLLKITNNLSEIKDAGPAAVAQALLNLGLGDAAKKGIATNAEMQVGTADKLVSLVGLISIFGKRTFTANDYIRIPDVPSGFIVQFGTATTLASG